MADPVQFEVDTSGVGVLTFNRPEVRNALNRAAMHALRDAIAHAESDSRLRVLIVTGAGNEAFVSGGDLRDLYGAVTEEDGLRQHDLMANALMRLAALPVPVVAALEGATRGGGCEIALACDLRLAATDATLGFAQIAMAVTPGWGGAERLIRLVGYARAFDLLLTGRVLSASEALAIGLVNELSPPGQALQSALALAARILQGPPLAQRGVKEVLHGYLALSPEEARARERAVFGRLWATADHAEALSAFLERRVPAFRGE